jgi:hypothetical protein
MGAMRKHGQHEAMVLVGVGKRERVLTRSEHATFLHDRFQLLATRYAQGREG